MGSSTVRQEFPVARSVDNFSIAEVTGDSYILLDKDRLTYHQVNLPAFSVWQRCDGSQTSAEIGATTDLAPELVELAIAELGEAGLLESPPEQWNARSSRRKVLKLGAAAALGAAIIPAVTSITVPEAAFAQTGACPGGCGTGECCLNVTLTVAACELAGGSTSDCLAAFGVAVCVQVGAGIVVPPAGLVLYICL